MGVYQDLQGLYPAIDGVWNKLSEAVLSSDPSLPEYISEYIDALGGMRACFRPGQVEASTLRFLAQSTVSNVQSDEALMDTPWASDIMRACTNVLRVIPSSGLSASDCREPAPAQPPMEQISPVRTPAATPASVARSEPPFAPALNRGLETAVPLAGSEQTFSVSELPRIPAPQNQSVDVAAPASATVVADDSVQLSSAAARAFGLSNVTPTPVARPAQAEVVRPEFDEDMPLMPAEPRSSVVSRVETVDETPQRLSSVEYPPSAVAEALAPAVEETVSATSEPAAAVPEELAASAASPSEAPATLVQPSDGRPSQDSVSSEVLDLATIEDELQRVFDIEHVDGAVAAQGEPSIQESVSSSELEDPVDDASSAQSSADTALTGPARVEPVLTPAGTAVLPEPVLDGTLLQPEQPAIVSVFSDPAVFVIAEQLVKEARESISGYIPRGVMNDDFVGLPADLRPENPQLASIFLNSGPVVIVQRIPGASVSQEMFELKRRVTATFELSLYKTRPFLDHWLLTNYCVDRMLAECFTPDGAVKDVKATAAYISVLGRIALYSEYFLATPFGMDLFETAMRMAHTLDSAAGKSALRALAGAQAARDQIDQAIRLIAKTSTGPNMMPPIYPYVVDWLAKMMVSISGDAATSDFRTLRDLSIGLSMVIIRCFSLGSKEIDSQVVAISNYFVSTLPNVSWC